MRHGRTVGPEADREPMTTDPYDRRATNRRPRRRSPAVLAAAGALLLASAGAPTRAPDVRRATVQLRNGNGRGSGTVVASVAGETLVLTATHVVRGATGLKVEIHRHNLGFAVGSLTEGGGWPRLLDATIVAADADTDVALVRVRGMVALPYAARLDPSAAEPAKGEVLTSVGIDRTLHLTLWKTAVEGSARIDLEKGGGPRRFTVTLRAPEHGRSGGGLFRDDGTVVGVCTGQLRAGTGPRNGAFASVESIRDLLRKAASPAANGPATSP